jgi:hypothetical protein
MDMDEFNKRQAQRAKILNDATPAYDAARQVYEEALRNDVKQLHLDDIIKLIGSQEPVNAHELNMDYRRIGTAPLRYSLLDQQLSVLIKDDVVHVFSRSHDLINCYIGASASKFYNLVCKKMKDEYDVPF